MKYDITFVYRYQDGRTKKYHITEEIFTEEYLEEVPKLIFDYKYNYNEVAYKYDMPYLEGVIIRLETVESES
jgi:hypothetical protein